MDTKMVGMKALCKANVPGEDGNFIFVAGKAYEVRREIFVLFEVDNGDLEGMELMVMTDEFGETVNISKYGADGIGGFGNLFEPLSMEIIYVEGMNDEINE